MTYDRQHLHMVWGGALPGGEIWSNSLRLAADHLGDDPIGVWTWQQLDDWLHGELKDEVRAWHVSVGAHIQMGATLQYVKLNYVNMAGHYVDPNTHEHVYSPPATGQYSGPIPPNQVALVVSLVTGLERGYAHRGRFYSPLPAAAVQDDGLISVGIATEVANAAAAFLTAVNDTPGLDNTSSPNVCVMSSRGTGATHVVTGVEVGRVLDTQRRRRADIPESWVAAPVST